MRTSLRSSPLLAGMIDASRSGGILLERVLRERLFQSKLEAAKIDPVKRKDKDLYKVTYH